MKPISFTHRRLMLTLLALALAAGPAPWGRAGRQATIAAAAPVRAAQDDPAQPAGTRTFTNSTPTTIPDGGNAAPSTISVTGMPNTLTAVRMILRFNHTNPDDLDIRVRNPQGQELVVMSDAGGGGDLTNATLIFHSIDPVPPLLPDNTSIPPTGTFRPTNYFGSDSDITTFDSNPGPEGGGTATFISAFNGADPNGMWSLIVGDDTINSEVGALNGWTLAITAQPLVLNLNDSGPGSLRQSLADAMPNDTVTFAPGLRGTITLNSTLTIDKSLAIGGPGKDDLTINGNNANRVFDITGSTNNVDITNLTIANGDAGSGDGGGIRNAADLLLSNVCVGDSMATNGGGIASINRVTIANSVVINNTATANGGGIYYVGAIASPLSMFNSTVRENMAGGDGGGLFKSGPGAMTQINNTYTGNTAINGGGLYINLGASTPATVINSTVSGNTATGEGGGLTKAGPGTLTQTNNTYTGNTAVSGGGFRVTEGIASILNTIAALNIVSGGTGPDGFGAITSQGTNLFGDPSGISGLVPSDLFGVNPNLTPLQNNGGPTLTHSPIAGSPAINAGNNAGTPSTDQRGYTWTGTRDIGAAEFNIPDPNVTLTITSILPTADPTRFVAAATLLTTGGTPLVTQPVTFRLFGDSDGDGDVDLQDTAEFLTNSSGATVGELSSSTSFQSYDIYADSDIAEYNYIEYFRRFGTSLPPPQGGGCQFLIFNADDSFAANGGNGTFNVTTFPQSCNWNAVSNDPFIQITSGGGTGNGVVNYTVAPHTDPNARRTGTITAAGITYNVLQGAAFLDVPESNIFYTFIGKLAARRVTLGIGGGNYGPDQAVTRGQMAAFIIRALGMPNPPPPAMQRFNDVPPSNIFYAFIEQMALRGITLGCSQNPPLYCPNDPVNRQQMAAFLIRALGEPNPPVPVAQRFNDVPPTNLFYRFIDRLAVRRITLGCGGGNYCPADPVTRAQMAAFLVRAFNL